MSLRVWMPFTKTTSNQGLNESNITVTDAKGSLVDGGKLGKCIHTTSTGNISLNVSSKLINTDDMTLSCWVKFNKAEIQSVVDTLTVTSTANVSTGSLIGNCNYGGFGLVWITNDIYASEKVVTSVRLFVNIRTSTVNSNTSIFSVDFDTWIHVLVLWRKSTRQLSLYRNGTLFSIITLNEFSDAPDKMMYLNYKGVFGGNGPSTSIPFYMNDLRIYDHALSVKEIKEISKGLVCHYTLSDNSIQTMTNCFNYPTFNTSSSTGGWSHWGSTGNKGSYGQTTDKQYIYNKDQQYAHWVQNAEGATVYYIMYQSPTFSGGTRSLCCIVKESNGLPITDDIVCPGWNGNSGTVPMHKWTSVSHLGNGFYLCKCEGFEQDGSNDLVCLCVYPPYRVYVSECYLENNRSVCADIFYNTTTVYDSSGYCNNGVKYGTFSVSYDSARCNMSTTFNGSDSYMKFDSLPAETKAISFWLKTTWSSPSASKVLFADKVSGLAFGVTSSNYVYINSGSTSMQGYNFASIGFVANQWNHIVILKTSASSHDMYVNGVKATKSGSSNRWVMDLNNLTIGCRYYSTYSSYFDGQLSDFRVYSTLLSEEDILELYHTPISIAKTGEVYTQGEYIEQ